jgi:hypothetical protein
MPFAVARYGNRFFRWASDFDLQVVRWYTEYDSKKKQIRGRFSVTFWPEIKGSWNAPDGLVFTAGEFHTKILE